jgi:succinate dehydrogenase hydrophobic anchor subunit
MNTTPSATLSDQDREHLRLLSIFHYIVAGITGLFALFPIIHLVIGLMLVTGNMPNSKPEKAWFGWFFVVFAAVFILCGLTLAGFIAHAGRCLATRRKRTLCIVMAALSCMMMPFGTVLGVFTLIVLMRPSVQTLFAQT